MLHVLDHKATGPLPNKLLNDAVRQSLPAVAAVVSCGTSVEWKVVTVTELQAVHSRTPCRGSVTCTSDTCMQQEKREKLRPFGDNR